MDGNRHYPPKVEALSNGEFDAPSNISIEQLQRLVRLLDGSDVSEIEVKHSGEGMQGTHLLLRKARASESSEHMMVAMPDGEKGTESHTPKETKHTVTAPLVGIFHVWARPKGGSLVAVGDVVKVDQLVGTIQSLNVINEVEAHVAGRVVEIFVQDGQPVEYGQPLMTIDSSEEA
ncbi:MAG: biotin/lipoyl-binding protein [Ktedonobacteraceae bacterium]|nr:biotin/lipoyl-binding protein [Ktedonobacteraceae bacterium]